MVLTILRRLMTWLHTAVHNEKYAPALVEIGALVLAVFIGIGIHRHFVPHITDVVQTDPVTKTFYVDKPVVSKETVLKVIADPKDRETITTLLKQQAVLQGQIVQLTNTVAELQTHGGTSDGGVITPVVEHNPTPGVPQAQWQFKDYQLDAKYSPSTFDYTLNQKFQVVTTTGKDKNGRRSELVSVFQQGPHGERIAVPAQTTAIVADNLSNHWFLRLNIQGGINVSPNEPGGIVGVQWLKKGTTKAPEDIRWAAATPVLFFSQTVKEPGILPVSLNLGNVKHQPFTNLWLSPYVGINPVVGLSRFGIALSSTF